MAQKWVHPSGPGLGKTAKGVAPHRGLLIVSSRLMWPGAWPGPRVGMKTVRHGSVPWAGCHQGGPGCCAQRFFRCFFFFFFASLVLQEQLLRDPTHSYTWLSPSLPLSAQGLPWGAEKGGGGAPRITLVPLHLSTWQRHVPMSETGRVIRLEEASLSISSPKT